MMFVLDHTYDKETDNLACDEALLTYLEMTPSHSGILRFWESDKPFVVLGLSNKISTETYVDRCKADNIKTLRRCSGGGTVLQGPGCLSYSLILPISEFPIESISDANCFIMSQNRDALLKHIPGVTISGYTDLSINGLKFSGNAQRRLKHTVLFHGTFLYNTNLIPSISKYLAMPTKEPDYRNNRSHHEFIQPLTLSKELIKAALISQWKSEKTLPLDVLNNLEFDPKYLDNAWHTKC